MLRYGETIACLREQRGLTQEELASRLGISRAALSHYETSRREADYGTLCKIAAFFDTTIDHLLRREPAVAHSSSAAGTVVLLDLTDDVLWNQCLFAVDGIPLTREERLRLLATIREQRSVYSPLLSVAR